MEVNLSQVVYRVRRDAQSAGTIGLSVATELTDVMNCNGTHVHVGVKEEVQDVKSGNWNRSSFRGLGG